MRIAITGSSGFIGSEVTMQLENLGHEIVRIHAPRLAPTQSTVLGSAAKNLIPDTSLVDRVRNCDVLINAAGMPDASESNEALLNGPNALLVALLGKACVEAAVPRFIHISSAVVQGDKEVLDSSNNVIGFSAYARSKIAGEKLGLQYGPAETVVYRPPSVHHESRRVTKQLHQLANSLFSTIASPGSSPTPQALLDSVGGAVLVLAAHSTPPPHIVHHPWEGLTTSTLLQTLGGGRKPRVFPRALARVLIRIGKVCTRPIPKLAPYIRRIELVWFGQKQADSWLNIRQPSLHDWEELATRVDETKP